MIYSSWREQSKDGGLGSGSIFRIFLILFFSRESFCLLTVSGQAEFFTPADILFHPDNIDLSAEQKQFYLCHGSLA